MTFIIQVSLSCKANNHSHPEGKELNILETLTACLSFIGLTYNGVIKQLEMSLQSLGVQSVHTFYLHWPDQSIPIEETLSAVQELYVSMLDKFF